ncbi:MAG: alpha/beta fold hydrolase [Actinophytocola sp.]|uniref:thioesterase II family protein n=1 Tax=Actinophytocola sp. TaxID=1872138 RepID=UPI0013283CAE|nr:alpha/beta fold hydrolase [Actinophytocola sp.]MPZ79308.1 alpha/beta fold hydrolase [Actinophytocola sp.]
MNWFVCPRPRPDAAAQLFCLPYAGAGASAFHRWLTTIGPDLEVAAVQLPGRENRIIEDPDFDIADLAEAIAERADRPYALYGHSLGGRYAFEVVRHLHHAGGTLPVTLYVGACRAPHIRAAGPFDGLSRLADEELLRRVVEGGGLSDAVLAEPELVELLLPVLRADFQKLDDYVFVAREPVPVPIVAFAGRDDKAVPLADIRAWDRHAGAGLTVHEVDGDHFFLHRDGTAVLELLPKDLLDAAKRVTTHDR